MWTCLVGCTLVWGGARCHPCANTLFASDAAHFAARLRELDFEYENQRYNEAENEASCQRKANIRRHKLNMHNWRRGHNGDMREEVVPSRLQMLRSMAISAKNPSVVQVERILQRNATRGGHGSAHGAIIWQGGLGRTNLLKRRGSFSKT